jgi:hypothetical protein
MALRSNIDDRVEVRSGPGGNFETPGTWEKSPGDPEAKAIIAEMRRRAGRVSGNLCREGEQEYIAMIDTALEEGRVHVDEVDGKPAWKLGPNH